MNRMIAFAAVLTVAALALSTSAAGADGENGVKYLDWDESSGSLVERTYTGESGDLTSGDLAEGWYIASGMVLCPDRTTVHGDVHIILLDGCTLSFVYGIHVPEGSSLTVYGQSEDHNTVGELAAGSGEDCAAIGGNWNEPFGTVTINGGFINAHAKEYLAGIGSGSVGGDGTVIINGGWVRSVSKTGGACIGAASQSLGDVHVTINGGNVICESYMDGGHCTGIGSGLDARGTTYVTINGGWVYATGNTLAPGIGACTESTAVVIINGGQVTANGGSDAPGVGASDRAACTVTINGGSVKAIGGSGGCPGIGTVRDGTCVTYITGGDVNATGSDGADGISPPPSSMSGDNEELPADDDSPGGNVSGDDDAMTYIVAAIVVIVIAAVAAAMLLRHR